MEDKVFCRLCGEWVQPIYGGECPNCGEDIPDYEFEEDFDWDDDYPDDDWDDEDNEEDDDDEGGEEDFNDEDSDWQ